MSTLTAIDFSYLLNLLNIPWYKVNCLRDSFSFKLRKIK